MALSASTLKGLIKTEMIDGGALDCDATDAFAEAIATAVVNHITSAAVVMPTSLIAPGGGGPVTGTGTIT